MTNTGSKGPQMFKVTAQHTRYNVDETETRTKKGPLGSFKRYHIALLILTKGGGISIFGFLNVT